MAELHIIGTLQGASGFPRSELCCKWAIVAGDDWKVIEGDTEGRTQVDLPSVSGHYITHTSGPVSVSMGETKPAH